MRDLRELDLNKLYMDSEFKLKHKHLYVVCNVKQIDDGAKLGVVETASRTVIYNLH
jgi:hypothetical protein